MNAGSKLLSARIALALSLAAAASPALAQSTDAAAPELEEIIVSATRRDENIQTIPVSIKAFSGEQLEKSGYVSVGQFLDSVPGVTSLAAGAGQNVVIIRNVATSTQEQGGAVTATYFDDFAISSPWGGVPEIKLVDMERVEVLKGPQGTLFGRSAMGGIVRYLTNKPDATALSGGVNAYVSSTTDGGDNVGGHAYLNLPITDTLAARFVLYSYQNSGFIDNVELGLKDYNDETTQGGRAAVRWTPTDTLTLDLTYLYQDLNAAPNWVTTIHTPEGDIPFNVESRNNVAGTRQEQATQNQYLNFRAEQQFDPFTITLLATQTRGNDDFAFDQREYVGLTSGCVCDYLDGDEHRGQSQSNLYELRLVSPTDQRFDYIVGLYHEDSEAKYHQLIRYFGEPQDIFGGFLTFTDGMVAIDGRGLTESSEDAAYGELGFKLSAQTRLAVGYRRSDVSYAFTQTQADGIFLVATGGTLNEGIRFSTDEKVSTYKATLEHDFNDDLFGYVLASSGYRRGGFNQPTFISGFSTYDSDSLWNYEVGVKSTWLDGRMTANLSAYYLDFSNMQLVVQDPLTFVRKTQNVGKARIPGVELSVAVQVTDSVGVTFNGSLSDPELLQDVPGGASGKKGDRLPGSAKEQFAVGVNLNRPIGHGFDLTGIASYTYVGDRLNDFNTDLDVALPSYSILDLRLGVRSDKGYSVSLFAANVLDKAAILLIDRQGPTFESVPTNRPRTIGVNFTYDF